MRFEKIITLPLGTLNGKICRLSMLESTFVYSFIVLVLMFFGLWRLAAILLKMNVHKQADVISLNYRSWPRFLPLIANFLLSKNSQYLSNRPHFLWVYRRDNPRGMLGEHEKSL